MSAVTIGAVHHPTARTWKFPPQNRPAPPGPVQRCNLRELVARPGRFEHHLLVVATGGVGQLECVTASEPLYFAHVNISDELAISLPTGDPLIDAAPFRTFLSHAASGVDLGRVNHRPMDQVLHPHGVLHWPGRLRAPYTVPQPPPGVDRRNVVSFVYCASAPTPASFDPRVSEPRQRDTKAYSDEPVRLGLVELGSAEAGLLGEVGDTSLSMLLNPGVESFERGAYVVVLTASRADASWFPCDLVYVPPGASVDLAGVERALLFKADPGVDAPPSSWSEVPSAPFPCFEHGQRGALPLTLEGDAGEQPLVVEDKTADVVRVSQGRASTEVPRYWLARLLFRLALHGYQLGYLETYGGFFYDDRGGYRLGFREGTTGWSQANQGGGGELSLTRAQVQQAVERLYRAVAPEGYVERIGDE